MRTSADGSLTQCGSPYAATSVGSISSDDRRSLYLVALQLLRLFRLLVGAALSRPAARWRRPNSEIFSSIYIACIWPGTMDDDANGLLTVRRIQRCTLRSERTTREKSTGLQRKKSGGGRPPPPPPISDHLEKIRKKYQKKALGNPYKLMGSVPPTWGTIQGLAGRCPPGTGKDLS